MDGLYGKSYLNGWLGVPLFVETPILNNDRNCWLSAFWDQLQLSKNLHHKILIFVTVPFTTDIAQSKTVCKENSSNCKCIGKLVEMMAASFS